MQIELVTGYVILLFLKKNLQAIFLDALFLLKCYKVEICQKDTVENHLKILVLPKNQN